MRNSKNLLKMNSRLILILILILIMVIYAVFFSSSSNKNSLETQGYLIDKTGIAFHDFNLMRLETGTLFEKDKKFLSSVDLDSRPYLLNFWATWCGPCRAEFDELEELWQESSALNGLAIIGVNVAEDEKKAKSFVESKSSTFEILLDLDSELSKDYKVTGIPATFLIYNSEVYDRWSGPISPSRVKASLKRLQEEGILDK